MPNYVKKTKRTYKKSRRPPWLATKPQMMSKTLYKQRLNQVDTKTFWFKWNSEIDCKDGVQFATFTLAPLYNIKCFRLLLNVYSEYKVLGYTLRLFPSNVGSEASADVGGQTSDYAMRRGNQVLWFDAKYQGNLSEADPQNIAGAINIGGARMIDPRRNQTRSAYRPKGFDEWTSTAHDEGPPFDLFAIDYWTPAFKLLFQDASSNPSTDVKLWFYTVQYKVVWRGRKADERLI